MAQTQSSEKSVLARWRDWLYTPTDASSLAVFRILFGAIMMWEVYRYFQHDRVYRYYIEPTFFFYYELFPFVRPLPEPYMYWVYYAMAIAAGLVMLGLFYRWAALSFFLIYTYTFLLDKAQYNNHYYLICLLGLMFFLVDAHRWASLDRWWNPRLRDGLIPRWQLVWFKAQVVIVYFFGGVAKINPDWLAGEPMRAWLANRAYYPIAGPFFTTEAGVYFFTYGGLLFDLFIGFLLLWKPTRWLAFAGVLFFNLTNHWLFSIGIFPFMMIATLVLFGEPDWPRRLLRQAEPLRDEYKLPRLGWQYAALGFVGVYLALQVLLPFRHFAYPGNVSWTEEGHRFAWHMKLRSKSGRIGFTVLDPQTKQVWNIDLTQDLTSRQGRKMAGRPDMILQYAHYLRDKFQAAGVENPVVTANSWASLNGRPYYQLIDPGANLATEQFNPFISADWILHLDETSSALVTQ